MKRTVAHMVLNDFVNDNRVLKECRSLIAKGYEVSVFCLKSERTVKSEIVDGIHIHRLDLWTEKLPSFCNPLKYLEFLFRMQLPLRKFDILHVNDFEPLPTAWLVKKFKSKIKLVYDSHEYQREKNGMGASTKKMIEMLEPIMIKSADAVITVSEGIQHEYKRLFQLDKVTVIFNAPHRVEVSKKDLFRKKFNLPDDVKIFLYQGAFHANRGVEQVIEAFGKMKGEKVAAVFMGSGPLQSKVEEGSNCFDNVFYHPAVPYSEILEHTASADFGLLTTENVCLNHYYCMPNKLFEYIQAGLPIISTDLFDCRRLIEKEKVGLILTEESAEGYIEVVRRACKLAPGHFDAALTVAKEKYHWALEEKKLISIYEQL
jgi:glycosyltransferase involved in cell wall biosynthesis